MVKVDFFTGWIKDLFDAESISADFVPLFRAKVPVQCVDLIQKTEYKLSFQTEICGAEEISPNVFRPVVNIAFKIDNWYLINKIWFVRRLKDVYY